MPFFNNSMKLKKMVLVRSPKPKPIPPNVLTTDAGEPLTTSSGDYITTG